MGYGVVLFSAAGMPENIVFSTKACLVEMLSIFSVHLIHYDDYVGSNSWK